MNVPISIEQPTRHYGIGSALMDNPRPAAYTLNDFLQWREKTRLEITPKFQRRGVWTPKQRSYFIDTLLREMPSPPLYLRNIYDIEKSEVVHEVIDGQQRLRAVLDFFDGKYALSNNLDGAYRGSKFAKLSSVQRLAIMKYKFNCETFEAISDQDVFEIFRRMNTYSTPLSKQELRHGNFFGPFSQACHKLAMEHLEFWRMNKIVSERKIARMSEVQLTSALLISQIDGMQDKNDSISDFYDKYDDKFPQRAIHERRFRSTIDQITETFGDALADSQFRNAPFFYTLFGVVFHRAFGMPNVTLKTTKKSLSAGEQDSLKSAAATLSNVITAARSQQKTSAGTGGQNRLPYPARFADFVAACLSGTDNVNPRQVRLSALYREAFD